MRLAMGRDPADLSTGGHRLGRLRPGFKPYLTTVSGGLIGGAVHRSVCVERAIFQYLYKQNSLDIAVSCPPILSFETRDSPTGRAPCSRVAYAHLPCQFSA